MKNNKKKGGIDKLLLGAVIGAAVGSVVGAGISSRSGSDESTTRRAAPVAVDKSSKKSKNVIIRLLRSVRLYLRNRNAKKK